MYTLILNGSPRKNGDTVKLLNMIIPQIKGKYKIINTFFEDISPCNDCRKCHTSSKCSINDNMTEFYKDLLKADNILLASPIHYSMLSGNLLNCISRFQYFFVSKNIRKDNTLNLKEKKGFLVLTGGGATKDFYPVEKVASLALREINAKLTKILKYTITDKFPLSSFSSFEEELKQKIKQEINDFTTTINGE